MAQAHPQARRYDAYLLRIRAAATGVRLLAWRQAPHGALAVGVHHISLWRRPFA